MGTTGLHRCLALRCFQCLVLCKDGVISTLTTMMSGVNDAQNRASNHEIGLPLYQVDAFTDQPFAGNPAAVCLLPVPREKHWMQLVAREMNLSETAFLHPENDGWRLRWFTPVVEVALCGHATLASAHVLWETGQLAPTATAHFYTESGLLTAERNGSGIELDFPAKTAVPSEAPAGLAAARDVQPP